MSEHDPAKNPSNRDPSTEEPASDPTPEPESGEPIPLEAEAAPPSERREESLVEPAAPEPGEPHIDSPGLLDDFDEDADFESDPEVDRVVRGTPVAPPRTIEPEPEPSPQEPEGEAISPGKHWKPYAIAGGVLTITAAVFAGIYGASQEWAHVLLALYRAALHTGTGVGAVVVSAILLGRAVGRFDSAASKMFLCVSMFLVLFNLNITLTGGKLEEIILGAAAYFCGLMFVFRMQPRDAAVVGGAHFGLALIVTLGNMLTGVVAAG